MAFGRAVIETFRNCAKVIVYEKKYSVGWTMDATICRGTDYTACEGSLEKTNLFNIYGCVRMYPLPTSLLL